MGEKVILCSLWYNYKYSIKISYMNKTDNQTYNNELDVRLPRTSSPVWVRQGRNLNSRKYSRVMKKIYSREGNGFTELRGARTLPFENK